MKQAVLVRAGASGAFELHERPDPTPAPNEVCIRVEAIGVNFADILARKGLYPDAPSLPAVIGYEVAGVVDKVGAAVRYLREGDPVLAMTRFGGYSSYVCVPEEWVIRRPEGMSAEEGAALPVNYLTAFQSLVVMGSIRTPEELGGVRQRVLVHNASGGVGTAAADIGRIFQVELFGTASRWKHAYLRERGYTHTIDYRTEDWEERVRTLTKGQGVDIVLDPIGGANWARSLRVLKRTGRLVLYGISSVTEQGTGKLALLRMGMRIPWLRFNPVYLINANKGVCGVNLGHLWGMEEDIRGWIQRLLAWYTEGWIQPHVDRVFPLEAVEDAHAYIEQRKNRGKVLLHP